jgi:3-oxoacyl-[acyl-carrier protein] reductase
MKDVNAMTAENAIIPDLRGKVILITGASTGIGASAARAFGRSGARVVVHYNASRDAAEKVAADIREGGGEALVVQGDVNEQRIAADLVAATVSHFGRLDVLVNNAGALVRRTRIEDYDDAYVDAVLDLNVRQVVRFVHEGAGQMRKQGDGGSIINLSSIAGIRALAGTGVYCTSKAALQMMSQVLALEVAADRIRVNLICPGLVEETELADPIYGSPEKLEEFYARLRPLHPLGRSGRPADIAELALFLASDASSWITGDIISVDGGRHLATNRPPL